MSSNVYYGVKDAEFNLSFVETKWLNLNEALAKLKLNTNTPFISISPANLIYPNELILSENTNTIIDILLLAKYTDKCGNLKLRSILLSQLINYDSSESTISSSFLKSNRLLILSLPKDSYFWSKCEAHLIPSFALRVGFDHIAKQFSYIGRMRVNTSNAISSPPRSSPSKSPATLSGLIGTVANLYEYIPAAFFSMHDLSNLNDKKLFANINQLTSPPSSPSSRHHEYFNHNNNASASLSNESFWSRLRSAIKNNSSSNEFNFNYLLWNNYEVLCLRQQPLKLKQSSILKLKSLEETTFCDIINNHSTTISFNHINATSINKSLRSLPNSIRHLVWPSYLERGQCIVKNGKMRSANDKYELEITSKGLIMFTKVSGLSELVNLGDENFNNNILKQVTTYEKNVESLVVTESGVFLTYDNNQAMRKPSQLYNHLKRKFYANSIAENFNTCESLLLASTSLNRTSFILELSDSGFLRVLFEELLANDLENNSKRSLKIVNIINLNEYFISLNNHDHDHPKKTSQEYQANYTVNPICVESSQDIPSVEINVKLIASVNGIKSVPLKLVRNALSCIKLLFESITRRVMPRVFN